jgi:TetR/AcrR family transcriptional regulator, regulator of cefoperazone and chloramphenicol sensitivity
MKDKLINIAIDRFGKRGFDAVGTREIADAAETAMSSITYHFGSKQGLYDAAAEHIAQSISAIMVTARADQTHIPKTPEQALDTCLNFLRRAGEMMLRQESAPWALFIIREQQAPTAALKYIFETALRPGIDPFLVAVAMLRPDLDERAAKATAMFLFGQAMFLRTARGSICLMMETDTIDAELQKLLIDQMIDNAIHVLRVRGDHHGQE